MPEKEHSHEHEETLKRKLDQEKSKNVLKTKKIKTLTQKLRRAKRRIFSLKCLMKELQSKNVLLEKQLLDHMPDICETILIVD